MRSRRTWHNVLDDENAGARFRPAADRLQNLPAFAVVPVVQDHVEAVDVCIAGHHADQSLETVISFLSLSHRLEVIADDLESCRNQALALTIERYWADYVL
jgi:hypothetical protein